MAAFIHGIATETPPHGCPNDVIRDRMKSWTPDTRVHGLIDRVYARSGIGTRYSAVPDFATGDGTLFRTQPDGAVSSPLTGERNRVYAEAARALAVSVARRALDGVVDTFRRDEVTHVVFASCTGFANPGPDYHIIRELGLREDVERYTVGFMGCYAAFPALRMAAQFCEADPRAVVLVVCLELCTLHFQPGASAESVVANALFADGAAAAVVGAREPAAGRAHCRLRSFRSALVPSGEAHMAWDIGDRGFNMVLTSYVPEIIGRNLRGLVGPALGRQGLEVGDVGAWVVHPGGRAILDAVESQLGLGPRALDVSRGVLRDFGNMSSATVLFVLRRMLDGLAGNPAAVAACALAFGPGLTVETAVMDLVGAGDAALG